jgi:hypothetical protein
MGSETKEVAEASEHKVSKQDLQRNKSIHNIVKYEAFYVPSFRQLLETPSVKSIEKNSLIQYESSFRDHKQIKSIPR